MAKETSVTIIVVDEVEGGQQRQFFEYGFIATAALSAVFARPGWNPWSHEYEITIKQHPELPRTTVVTRSRFS